MLLFMTPRNVKPCDQFVESATTPDFFMSTQLSLDGDFAIWRFFDFFLVKEAVNTEFDFVSVSC